jgi:hypothetical protein
MKRPSFQFYPSDWLRDTALRSCSTGARGLWIDMICWMHEGTPYGHLKVGQKVILPSNLARMVGEPLNVVEGWIEELKSANVFQLADDGTICSRRMIRDENLRNARAEGGKLGGNPNLKVNLEANLDHNHKVDQEDKQNPTPSSSSSSSSSYLTFSKEKVVEDKPSTTSKIPECPHEKILDLWQQVLPELPQHLRSQWNAARQQALRTRWKAIWTSEDMASEEEALDYWRRLFVFIRESKFLMGKTSLKDRPAFQMTLEWLIKPANWSKVVEGKYHA